MVLQFMTTHFSPSYRIDVYPKGFKPLLIAEKGVVLYKGGNIYYYSLQKKKYKFLIRIPISLKWRLFSKSRILTRIFRLEPRGVVVANKIIYFGLKGKLFSLNLSDRKSVISKSFRKNMNSPLYLTRIKNLHGFSDGIAYGEYFSNPHKKSVNIYYKPDGCSWQIVYTFPQGVINHVHNMIPDYNNNTLWVLTGDDDSSSRFWKAKNHFQFMKPYNKGYQKFRSCVILSYKQGLVWPTDSPEQRNYVYWMKYMQEDFENKNIITSAERYPINGPVVNAVVLNEKKAFVSTTVEPKFSKYKLKYLLSKKTADGIISPNCIVYKIQLNYNNIRVDNIVSLKKDILPGGLFSFGNIDFPVMLSDNINGVFIYVNSCSPYDGRMIYLHEKE